tara:strand:- start:48 stop:395 length:348 start_codon:yes stop_codon:yes gene_type:complete
MICLNILKIIKKIIKIGWIKMKGYWIAIYEEIHNVEKLKEYAVKAKEAVTKFSGKFIVRGGKNIVNEGIKYSRTVVVEFPDLDSATKCYNSKEYQEAHEILKGHVKRSHQIIEGT